MKRVQLREPKEGRESQGGGTWRREYCCLTQGKEKVGQRALAVTLLGVLSVGDHHPPNGPPIFPSIESIEKSKSFICTIEGLFQEVADSTIWDGTLPIDALTCSQG